MGDVMTDKTLWLEVARTHAETRWGYGEAIDEMPEWFDREFEHGSKPVEAVDRLAEKYDWIDFESSFTRKAS